ncbi:MAG: alpha-galactosidase [Candidatus Zipacnadales bacterium]
MPKIAMIGAGSIVFSKTLSTDILATPGLQDCELVLMGPTMSKIEKVANYLKRVIKDNGLAANVWATTDRREALNEADYVVVMLQIGGVEAFEVDYKVPLKHGVDQCIGDTLGPGGVFRALRTIPVVVDIACDMEELCPDALLLNYANPMAPVCWAIGRESTISYVGLCHGVQTTLDLISRYVGVPKEQIDFLCAGINHMAWFLKLEHQGEDLYPRLRENCEKPEYYVNEKVRCEVMRHFGYFMTESTGHLSEYVPWFRSSRRALELYCDGPDFGGASGAYYNWCRTVADAFKGQDVLADEPTALPNRSAEYCGWIIEAMETDKTFRFNGNVTNKGYITNLPQGCCVEVPTYVDRTGLHPTVIGDLPPQCAALNQSNVSVQGLAVEAALSGDPELAFQACAMDPLTSACLTLAEIREMVAEMLEASRKWLPQFEGTTLKKTPRIDTMGVKGVSVPTDPALVVAARFIELIEKAQR